MAERTIEMSDLRRAFRPVRPSASVTLGLASAGLILWFVAIRQADFLSMGALGLISILPWTYFAGLALAVIGFSIELLHVPLRPHRLVALIVVLVVFLFGTACAVEPGASLGDSWLMAGFTQYVLVHGHVLHNFDTRFSWPGGFSLGAVLVAFTGKANVLGFIRWFPLVIELMYLAPLMVIARFSGAGRRAGWLGIALFYVTNWIFQDYYSPQALNYLFFLVIIAAVLTCWHPKRSDALTNVASVRRERVRQSRDFFSFSRLNGRDASTDLNSFTALSILGLLGLICLASAMSHQLTPLAIVLALGMLLLTRRLGWPELVLVALLLAFGWLSLGASNYWVGHLSNVFGDFEKFASTYGQNLTGRITGSASHMLVMKARIVLTAALYLFAVIGFLRRSTDSRALEALAIAPFALLAAQNYGGGDLSRVVLFALPFVSLLAASALLPQRDGTVVSLVRQFGLGRYGRWILCAGAAVVLVAFSVSTTLVRGGNDAYEAFSKGETDAVVYAYNHSGPGETIGMVAPYLPLGLRNVATERFYIATTVNDIPSVRHAEKALLTRQPAFIILSQSQEAWGEIVAGYRVGWEESVESYLVVHGYRIAAEWPTATVLRAGTAA